MLFSRFYTDPIVYQWTIIIIVTRQHREQHGEDVGQCGKLCKLRRQDFQEES